MRLNCEYVMVPRILYNDKLSFCEANLLGLIISLTLKNNYCYASNEYLANYLNKSKRTITESLSKLKKLKYIYIKYINGGRRIYLNSDMIPLKDESIVAESCDKEVAENYYHNIKSNNKINNKRIIEPVPKWMTDENLCQKQEATPEEHKEMEELINEICEGE